MPRFRNSNTGAVVEVGDVVAGRLGPVWVPADQSSADQPKTSRRSRKSDDD